MSEMGALTVIVFDLVVSHFRYVIVQLCASFYEIVHVKGKFAPETTHHLVNAVMVFSRD